MQAQSSDSLRQRLRPIIPVWFLSDVLVALTPPLHWAVGTGKYWFAGLPVSLIYFCGSGAFIAASILFAHWVESGCEATCQTTH